MNAETAVFFVPLDRLRDVLSPQVRVYEIYEIYEILAMEDRQVDTPRQFVVLPPKRAKELA